MIRLPLRSILLPAIAALCAPLLIVCSAHAATINGLYSTGVDSGGNILPGGSQDSHYNADSSGPAYVLSSRNLWPTWPTSTTGAWINYVDSSATCCGSHTFATSFNLTGLDPSSAEIQLTWTGDNATNLYLNGTLEASLGQNDFSSLHNTTINSGFINGLNVLSFTVSEDSFDGLLISSISGTATPTETPLPAALPMFAGGLTVLNLLRRRRKRKAQAVAV